LKPNLDRSHAVDVDKPERAGLIPIGQAARRLGVTTAALRFYERRGLVASAARDGGQRWYGRAELRRIAFIRTAQELGMNLNEIATLVHSDGTGWRELVMTHIDQLHRQRAWIETTLTALQGSMTCPRDHPLLECQHLIDALDERVDSENHSSGDDVDPADHRHRISPSRSRHTT
jgi:DNA-binding transcriptional MerR regulator